MDTGELFLNCISAYLTGRGFTAPEDFDRDALLALCREQKLTAPVYSVLHDEALGSAWRMAALADVSLQVRRNAEFQTLCEALAARGIRPLITKGLVCRETYPEPDARISSDEDLFVPREDYPRFHETMLELGFDSETPDLKNAHEVRYFRNDLMVEGHWELFPQDNTALNALNALSEGFWQRTQAKAVGGATLLTLDPTDHMTFLLLHLFKHFINSGAGVRQICDVAQWAKAHAIDWTRVRAAMHSAHAERFAGAVFDAGERYFGMPFPDGWPRADCAALLDDALGGGIYGSATMSRKHSGSMTLAAVEDADRASRPRALLRTLFPNRAVMETSFPWVKRSAALLPAAWTLRIVRYLRSRDEDNTASESMRIGAERMELLRYYQIL